MFNKNDNISLISSGVLPKAAPTPTNDLMTLFRLANKMEKICTDERGVGLSAVQVGVGWNFFIVQKRNNHFDYYLNCSYEGVDPKVKSVEGCLSLRKPDNGYRRFELQRYEKIKLTGQQLIVNGIGLDLMNIDFEISGFLSIIFQHEIDHGNDILISDIGREIEILP